MEHAVFMMPLVVELTLVHGVIQLTNAVYIVELVVIVILS